MRPTHWLFDLVHALSPSEKRYFRLYAAQSSGDSSNYLRLFDYLNGLDHYDESQAKGHFAGDSMADNLASEKNYLFRLILKAMRAYRSRKSATAIIQEHIKDLYFLSEKRLFDICNSVLKKAKKLAKRFDLYSDWLKLLQFERRFIKFLYNKRKDLEDRITQLNQERREITALSRQENRYILLYDQLLVILRQKLYGNDPAVQNEVRAHLSSELLAAFPQKGSFHARSYFYVCRAMCQQILGDREAAFQSLKDNIQHWQDHPHRIKDEPYQYQRALSNYLGTCYQVDRMDAYADGLALMDSLPRRNTDEKAEYFSNYYFHYFFFHLSQHHFEEALKSVPEVQKGLKQYASFIPASRVVAFHFNVATVFFMTQNYSQSIKSLLPLLHAHYGDVRQDLQRQAVFMTLAAHFSLGNWDLWESQQQTALSILKNSGTLREVEQQMLRLFQAMFNQPQSPRSSPELIQQYREQLSPLWKASPYSASAIQIWMDEQFKER